MDNFLFIKGNKKAIASTYKKIIKLSVNGYTFFPLTIKEKEKLENLIGSYKFSGIKIIESWI